mgnify:CR=1 FL=1
MRVPSNTKQSSLTVEVSFDSGPLAGMKTAVRKITVAKAAE